MFACSIAVSYTNSGQVKYLLNFMISFVQSIYHVYQVME